MALKDMIGKEWSVFIDRDGVINKRLIDDYVKNWSEFEFLSGSREAVSIFNKIFKHVFVVTNQRGIARELMSEDDLAMIHKKMVKEINSHGGELDAIFYCPHDRDSGCSCRKPAPGMAIDAQGQYPDVDFEKSVMVGDSCSDMEFGIGLGMKTVFITTSSPDVPENVDLSFESLQAFANYLID